MNTDEKLKTAGDYFDQRKYNKAMIELIHVLSEDPENKAARELAQSILSICMVKNPPERLKDEITYDSVLDPLFAACDKCGKFWAVNPVLKDVASVTVFNPIGGACSKCHKVYCAACARQKDNLVCPDCSESLVSITRPNGRSKKTKKHNQTDTKIRYVLVFKEPPEPIDIKRYSRLVLETLCPEALQEGVRMYAETANGPVDQMYALARAMYVKPELDLKRYDVFTQSFTDKDGGRGLILKVYEKN